MKIQTAGFFTLLSILLSITVISSCSKTDYVAGTWLGNPERITGITGASDATATTTIDFAPLSDRKGPGQVLINAVFEIQQAVVGASAGENAPYQANITASASISGTYIQEEGDDDDYILSLDASTLKVDIDPDGVVYTQNVVDGNESPMLDSLTTATIGQWRVIISAAAREQFYKYSRIEDVKVHHGDMMSMEVGNRDMTLRRVAQN